MRKSGLISIFILEILERYASNKHRLYKKDIEYFLDINYGETISRNTLSQYLAELRDAGYIEGKRGVYKVNRFDDHELRLLIDGVLFGQHIPKQDAERLIDKLKTISYKNLSSRIKHICYLEDLNRTSNTKLYEIIDVIDEAIERGCQVELTYCGYDVNGQLHDREVKIVEPYYLVTDKSKYYLICYAGRDDIEPRRLDRLSNVSIINKPRRAITSIPKYVQGFDLAKYMREHIYMFSGESVYVTLKIKSKSIGDFIDWFGKGYRVIRQEDEYVTVKIRAVENAVYYWALQYGGVAEVLAPQSLRMRLREGLREMLQRYEENI